MDCQQAYSEFQNQIVQIEFTPESDAYKSYGAKLVGFLYYPMVVGEPFYANVKVDQNTTQYQLVRLSFKVTPGFKLRFGVSNETEKLLMDKGFACADVKAIFRPNEFILEVTSNVVSNAIDVNFLTYSAVGIWGINQQNSIVYLKKAGLNPVAMPGNQFYELCNQIRSCQYDEIENVFRTRKIDLKIDQVTNEELDLIKALVNIFTWLEYYLVEGDISPDDKKLIDNNEFLPKMYNDFVTDAAIYGDKLKDLYFLDQRHQFGSKTVEHLEQLFKLKLLSKVALTVRNVKYENYFVPFTKPKNYKVIIGNNETLQTIYNQILLDRNVSLTNFYNNR